MSNHILGYGSLLWRPAFPFLERTSAVLHGFSRRFWQGSPDHRGTPDAPGRVVTVLPDFAASIGVMIYRIAPKDRAEILGQLGHREQAGYSERTVEIELPEGTVEALLYAAEPGNPSWAGPAPVPDIARQIERCRGPSGGNLSYLLQLERALHVLGHPDPHVAALSQALERPWRPAIRRVPRLSTAQMIEVDRRMIDGGITLTQMMENAGRALARVAQRRFLGVAKGARVIVLAGSGGNGGGALVAARRLAGWGAEVQVTLTRDELAGVPAQQLRALRFAGVPVRTGMPTPQGPVDLVIDGLIGYSLRGTPTGAAAAAITWANQQQAPILSLDIPSGVHATSGPSELCLSPTATVTLALPKQANSGELYLADIGVPPSLYEGMGLGHDNPFTEDDVVRVD